MICWKISKVIHTGEFISHAIFGGGPGIGMLGWAKSRDSYRRMASESAAIESLAFVGGHISPRYTEMSPHRPCVCCAAIRIARLAFTRLTFVPCGTALKPACES